MSSRKTSTFNPTATESILESISDGVFTVDANWRITSFNRAAESITGIPRKEALGKPCSEVFRSSMCEASCALRQTLQSGSPLINRHCFIIDGHGRRIPISVSTAVLRDRTGKRIGGAETFRDLSELEELRRELEGRFTLGDLVSRSPAMQPIFELVPALARSSSTALIQGETGTGKELVARAIHALGTRSSGPFVAVNCSALPDTLLESELFGYRRGAFTGAVADKAGRFALAEHGTLFLDEIGDISPALQARLLRVLQERCYEPLGATRSVKTDVRIIAATNRNLGELVRAKQFREDLFYRLDVVRVDLPPLRQRKEDIPLLVEHFITHFNRLERKALTGVHPDVFGLLMAHDWPGNVRELHNVIERAFVLCQEGLIGLEHLPVDFVGRGLPHEVHGSLGTARRLLEAQTIRQALARNANHRLAAARELGLHKSTLFRRIKALGLE
jgi:PAS domain S-box-containing protein